MSTNADQTKAVVVTTQTQQALTQSQDKIQAKTKSKTFLKQTLLKDLPMHIIKMLPTAWSLEKGINDPVNEPIDDDGTTPLLWALQTNNNEVIDALLQCEDLDLDKSDNLKRNTPLCLAFRQRSDNFKNMLMKGSDPTIEYLDTVVNPINRQNIKILDEVMHGGNFGVNFRNFSLEIYRRNGYHAQLPQLLQYISNATQPLVSDHVEICNLYDLRNEFPYCPTDLFKLISTYVGQPRNINDFSFAPLDLTVQNWIQNTGKLYEEQMIEDATLARIEKERLNKIHEEGRAAEAKATQQKLQAKLAAKLQQEEFAAYAKAMQQQLQYGAAIKAKEEAEKRETEFALSSLTTEVTKLNRVVESQALEIKQLKEMMSLVIDLFPSTNKSELTKLQSQMSQMKSTAISGLTFAYAATAASTTTAAAPALAQNTVNTVIAVNSVNSVDPAKKTYQF